MSFPTKDEFLKDCLRANKDTDSDYDIKKDLWDNYFSYEDWYEAVESCQNSFDELGESESDFVEELSKEELWNMKLKTAFEILKKEIRESIPEEELLKFATKQQKEEYERLQQIKIEEEI